MPATAAEVVTAPVEECNVELVTHGRTVRLLYVEDDTVTMEMVSNIILRRFPCVSLITAENGKAGLELFEKHRPQIVLTDISMPVMNGIDMARSIRAMDSSVHIIAATALSDTRYLLDAIKIGISRYVLKPIDFDLLFEALADCQGRILLERQLREQQEFIRKLSLAVEQNPSMVVIANARGAIEYVNSKFSTISGYARAEIMGQSLRFLLADATPIGTFEVIWSTITRGLEWRGEFMNRKKSGELYHEDVSISALKNDDGEITHFVAVLADITEGKRLEKALLESEKQFRTLCDFAPIGIFRADGEGNNIYCNARWEEISGLCAAEAAGKGWRRVMHPDDLQRHGEVWQEALATGKLFTLEHRQITPAGKEIWVRVLVSPIKGMDGKTVGFVGTLEDITELLQARQEMLKTQKLESLGLLAGGIAHDFNNILTGILGNISLASFQLDDPQKVALRLANAEKATARAKELTQQLLTFARGGEPIKKVISLHSLLKEAADFALHGSSVRCRFSIPDDLWPVEADEGQLIQVVHNLILNAVQAMPEGGTISISGANVCRQQEGKRFVKIAVTDTGVGIAEHHLLKIFDPYFTTKQQGSGLGLATCYSIIRKHDGTIRASSTPGKGSSFRISLPAAGANLESEPPLRPAARSGSGRVLVMDDEQEVREISREILEELGYSVECVEHGAEAIELYRQREAEGEGFSAVILDLTVPGGIGGKETIRRLREFAPDVKAIVSSGYSNDPVMANYRDYGFGAVLTKPYRPREMNEALQALF